MAQEAQPIPHLNLASSVVTPNGRTVAEPMSAQAIGSVVSSPFLDPSLSQAGAAARATTVERTGFGHPHLQAQLFLLDLLSSAICWVGFGAIVDRSSTAVGTLGAGVAASVAMLLAMRSVGLYQSRRCARRVEEVGRLAAASIWGAAAFVIVQAELGAARPEILAVEGASIALMGAARWRFARFLRAQRAQGRYLRGLVLVGAGADAKALRAMLRSEPELGYSITGVVGPAADDPTWSDLPTSRTVENIARVAMVGGANGVVIVPYGLSSTMVHKAIRAAGEAGLHVQIWPALPGVGSRRLRSVPMSGEPFFYVEPAVVARWQLALKRAMDIVGACVVLAFCAPLLAVAAACIKLEDHGPVFYRDERIGLGGRVFRVYKLRSMQWRSQLHPSQLTVLNERTDGPLFKASHDPRVTRVGRLLRATSVDELPQLWNVVRGTMSLVGPRPALPS